MRVRNTDIVWLAFLISAALSIPAEARTESVLYSFPARDEGIPLGRLLLDAGSLFGTASDYDEGDGEVFELMPSGDAWTETTLENDGDLGGDPLGGLIEDSSGNLYGTMTEGGFGFGTVFEFQPEGNGWNGFDIYDFQKRHQGEAPSSDLIMVGANLYGTTPRGGSRSDAGCVFKLHQTVDGSWKEKVLYAFTGGLDGGFPNGGLHWDSKARAFFGVTGEGGAYGQLGGGFGTVFKLKESDGEWTETVLHSFGSYGDGVGPVGVLAGKDGANILYGATGTGSTYQSNGGTVFKVYLSGGEWKESTIHGFAAGGGQDGVQPNAGLYMDKAGDLYGTTTYGGDVGSCGGESGDCGIVFKLSRSGGQWNETILHTFGGSGDGENPYGAVIMDPAGNIYGTTAYGGADAFGTVYEITP